MMDYNGGAENARVNTSASIASSIGKLGEENSKMMIVTDLLMESGRSYAASAEGGRRKSTFTKTTQRGMA
jgi:hypothetical protein